jgi:hypothetical protein
MKTIVVDNVFIRNHLGCPKYVLLYQIWNSKSWTFQNALDGETPYNKAVMLNKI